MVDVVISGRCVWTAVAASYSVVLAVCLKSHKEQAQFVFQPFVSRFRCTELVCNKTKEKRKEPFVQTKYTDAMDIFPHGG